MIRRPPRSTLDRSSASADVYKRQGQTRFPIETSKFAELKVDSWPLGMAVKVEEMELAEAIGGALADLKRDGSIAAIFKRHGISYFPA